MFGRSGRDTPVEIGQRLTVPVLAATGGSGRSTSAAMVAAAIARHARALVLDSSPGVLSPWRDWITRPGTGLAALADWEGVTAKEVFAAASRARLEPDFEFSVLTDTRERDATPLVPLAMAGWQRLVDHVAPRAVVVDTHEPLLLELARMRGDQPPAKSAGWLTDPAARPVLCAPSTARGIDDALVAVTAIEQLGLGADRLAVAVVGLAASDLPRRVLAGLTLMQGRVAGVVHIPHDRHIRTTGRPHRDRVAASTRRAVDELVLVLTDRAHEPAPSMSSERGGTAHAVATHG